MVILTRIRDGNGVRHGQGGEREGKVAERRIITIK